VQGWRQPLQLPAGEPDRPGHQVGWAGCLTEASLCILQMHAQHTELLCLCCCHAAAAAAAACVPRARGCWCCTARPKKCCPASSRCVCVCLGVPLTHKCSLRAGFLLHHCLWA
jgi:hypothetical protein